MIRATRPRPSHSSLPIPGSSLWTDFAVGCGFWLAIMLLLEPANLARGFAGYSWTWREEVVRIGGASLLGAAVTPILFALSRRFPLRTGQRLGDASFNLLGAATLAILLAGIADPLASLVLPQPNPFSTPGAGHSVLHDGPLLFLGLVAMLGMKHAARLLGRETPHHPAHETPSAGISDGCYLQSLALQGHGGLRVILMRDVRWMEAQGNYVGLHSVTGTYLARYTMAAMEAALDPDIFLRVHRGAIVNVNEVLAMTTARNGDACVRLTSGAKIKVSRGRRTQIKGALLSRSRRDLR